MEDNLMYGWTDGAVGVVFQSVAVLLHCFYSSFMSVLFF